MAIETGRRLGAYEIVAPLGAGGMGEVYRATDPRLGREVALKLLPEAFASDPERLARFEREARLLASLNHPNIAHVYGFESATLPDGSGVHFLAMELVPGEDLAERLKRVPVPVDEAIAIAKQIVDALEEAHEKGIVHRDLKPANVKLTPDGKVKVLDFGLAKAYAGDTASGSPADLSQSPTLAHTGTHAGLILGTAAYMSPEQARGKPVDKRADIWAFGVVIYEMLTGRQLFAGETVSDVLAAVLTWEPDLAALPATTPPSVARLLRRCLVRDPRSRLRDIGDARIALGELDVAIAPASPRARALPWIAAALGIGLGLFAMLRGPGRPGAMASTPTMRFTLLPQPAGDVDGFPAISPDGQTIVFGLMAESGVPHLWAMSFATGESRLLPGTEYGTDPFWSPDGRFVAYFSRGQLRRLEVATGLSRALAAASDPRGGTWSEAGEIVFTPNSATGLLSVPADGGTASRVTELDASAEESHRYPTALPGGEAIVYGVLAGDQSEKAGTFWRSLRDGRTRRLATEISRTAYDSRGYLFWVRQGALVAQRFDPREGELAGEPFPIAERVGTDAQRQGKGWFAAAAGVVATRAGTSQTTQLRWYDRAGKRLADLTSPGAFYEPAASPDGKHVAVQVGNLGVSRGDVWIFDVGGQDRGRRLTFGGVDTPAWTPDGRWVVYTLRGKGGTAILRKLADGSGPDETLHLHPQNAFVSSISPREPLLAFETYDRAGGLDVSLLSLEGERKARPFLQTAAAEAHAAFSPDGRLLAYSSDESGLPQIYVKEIGGAQNRWQLTTGGGDQAAWSADSREIYYVGLDRVLRALPIRSLAPFEVGEPLTLFKLEIPTLAISGNRTFYAPSPDRQRFLVNTLVAPESEPGLRVVLNWRPPAGETR